MITQLQTQTKAAQQPSFISSQTGLLQRKCACGQHTIAGGECEECRQKREGTIQRAAVSAAPTNGVPPIVHDVLSSSGQPLDAGTRAFMEPRFEHDFSKLKIQDHHRDAEGEPLDFSTRAFMESRFGQQFDDVRITNGARQLPKNAIAAAQGNQLSFAPWLGQASTPIRRAVIAHEMAHVLQWRRGQQTSAESWSEQTLESEARDAGLALADGQMPTVRGVARDNRPRFHPVFISTFGRRGFLEAASDFHKRWGFGTPVSVSSIEEIVTQLAKETGHLDRITIVSHAVPNNINISFLRGGPGFVDQTEWHITTRESLPEYSRHSTVEGVVDRVMEVVRADQANAQFLSRLSVNTTDPLMRQFIWWLIDANFLDKVQPAKAIPNRKRVVRRARENARVYKKLLKDQLGKLASLTVRGGDIDLLERAINNVLRHFHWDRLDRQTGLHMSQEVQSGREAAVQRVLQQKVGISPSSSFQLALASTQLRFDRSSVIEIKGCRIGQNQAYLEAISRFFGNELGAPQVTAPDMFQMFGHMGWQPHLDSTKHLRGLWMNKSIRRAFLYWALVFGWHLSDPPVADDLVTALRAGGAFPVGPILHFLARHPRGNVINWFARFGYPLSNAPDIESTFFTGRPIEQAISHLPVDWLQDRRDGERPTQFIFPPDPDYQNHIIRAQVSLGLGDFPLPSDTERAV